MTRLRAFLIALTILAMAVSPLLVPAMGLSTAGTSNRAFAAPAGAPAADDDDDDDDDDNSGDDDDDDDNDADEDNDNSGDDDDDADNDDADDDNEDADNDDENDNDSDEDDSDDSNDNESVAPPPAAAPAPPSATACSTPGQEMAFQSDDGRVTARVFGTMSQSLKFSIRLPIDPASVPPAPGPVAGGLLFQLLAETCDGGPLAVLPAEINLGVRYNDSDAAGLNEANFTLARLDTNTNQWQPSMKQATDPPANFTSATITDMGYYVVYQRP
jgi:hypothetical protein